MKTLYRSDKLHVYIDDSDVCSTYLTIETGERDCTGTGISFSFAELQREAGIIVDEGLGDEEGEPGIDYERRCAELETVITELVKTVSTLTAMMKPVVFVAEDEDKVAKIKKFLNENTLDI